MNHHPNGRATVLVATLTLLVAQAANCAVVLIDFGNNTSFRGASVSNPDPNGNHWNSIQPGLYYQNLVNTANTPTPIAFGFSTNLGTDSYNGPAGDTSAGMAASHVGNTDIDTVALGILGVRAAAFDYVTNTSDTDPLRFEIQFLDPGASYKLTFFGSHKFNTDNVTRYSIYSDGSYTTLVRSVDLLLGLDGAHNRDQTAVINNVAPQADNILYVQVDGANNGSGYLNSLALETVPEPSTALMVMGGGSLLLRRRRRISPSGGDCAHGG